MLGVLARSKKINQARQEKNGVSTKYKNNVYNKKYEKNKKN